ncbi:hypothetical protein [Enterovirga rhinocerotis]|uniref:Lipoprotein n=1 Tax=Enterovirga rhinocerotis TaxID=1339210 RepID=A0A4R7C871_9HYPH|nr:hypothetical protein [Enterovirga rhinocerotis]TDR94810.1 hypothetical protein EV668_2099 [Enterovirga rhinocerotis]
MLLRALTIALLSAAVAGCSGSSYPVYGNPVNPTPAPGYRVVCDTWRVPSHAACSQYVVPAEAVVRTRG